MSSEDDSDDVEWNSDPDDPMALKPPPLSSDDDSDDDMPLEMLLKKRRVEKIPEPEPDPELDPELELEPAVLSSGSGSSSGSSSGSGSGSGSAEDWARTLLKSRGFVTIVPQMHADFWDTIPLYQANLERSDDDDDSSESEGGEGYVYPAAEMTFPPSWVVQWLPNANMFEVGALTDTGDRTGSKGSIGQGTAIDMIAYDIRGAGFVADALFEDPDFVVRAVAVCKPRFLHILCRCPEEMLKDPDLLRRLQKEGVLTTATSVADALKLMNTRMETMLQEGPHIGILTRAVATTLVTFDAGVVAGSLIVTAFDRIDRIVDHIGKTIRKGKYDCWFAIVDEPQSNGSWWQCIAATRKGHIHDITATLESINIVDGTCFYFDANFLLSAIAKEATEATKAKVLMYASKALCHPDRTFMRDALRSIGGANAAIMGGLCEDPRFEELGFSWDPLTGKERCVALRLGEQAMKEWILADVATRSKFPKFKNVPVHPSRCNWQFLENTSKYTLSSSRCTATIKAKSTTVYGAPVREMDEAGVVCWRMVLPETNSIKELSVGIGHPGELTSRNAMRIYSLEEFGGSTIDMLMIRGYGNGTLVLYKDGILRCQIDSPFIAGRMFPCVIVRRRKDGAFPKITIGSPWTHTITIKANSAVIADVEWARPATAVSAARAAKLQWKTKMRAICSAINDEFKKLKAWSEKPFSFEHDAVTEHQNLLESEFNRTFDFKNVDLKRYEEIRNSLATLRTLFRTGDAAVDGAIFTMTIVPEGLDDFGKLTMPAKLTDDDIRAILWTQIDSRKLRPLIEWRDNTLAEVAKKTNPNELAAFREKWKPVTARVFSEIKDKLSTRELGRGLLREKAYVYGYLSEIILGVQLEEKTATAERFASLYHDAKTYLPACKVGARGPPLPKSLDHDLATLRGFNRKGYDRNYRYMETAFNSCLQGECHGDRAQYRCSMDKPLFVQTTGGDFAQRIEAGDANFRTIVEEAEETNRQRNPWSMPLRAKDAAVFWDGACCHFAPPQFISTGSLLPRRSIEFVCILPFESDLYASAQLASVLRYFYNVLQTTIDDKVIEGVSVEQGGFGFFPDSFFIAAPPRRYVCESGITFGEFFGRFPPDAVKAIGFTEQEAEQLTQWLINTRGCSTLLEWRDAFSCDFVTAQNLALAVPPKLPECLCVLLEDIATNAVFKGEDDDLDAGVSEGLRPDQIFRLGQLWQSKHKDKVFIKNVTDYANRLFELSILSSQDRHVHITSESHEIAIPPWEPRGTGDAGYYRILDSTKIEPLDTKSIQYLLCGIDETNHTTLGIVTLEHWAMHTIRKSFETVDSNTDATTEEPFEGMWDRLCRTGIAPTPTFKRTGLNINRHKFLGDPLVGRTRGNCIHVKLVLATLVVSNGLTSGADITQYMDRDELFRPMVIHLFYRLLLFERAVDATRFHEAAIAPDDTWFAVESYELIPNFRTIAAASESALDFLGKLQLENPKFWNQFKKVTDPIRTLYEALCLQIDIDDALTKPPVPWQLCVMRMCHADTSVRHAATALILLFRALSGEHGLGGNLDIMDNLRKGLKICDRTEGISCTLGNIVNACIHPQSEADMLGRTVPEYVQCSYAMSTLLDSMTPRFKTSKDHADRYPKSPFAHDLTRGLQMFGSVVMESGYTEIEPGGTEWLKSTTVYLLNGGTSRLPIFVLHSREEGWKYNFNNRHKIPVLIYVTLA